MKRVALILTLLLAPIHSANSVDIPEYCADTTSFQIRTSNVIERCEANEISLGVGALNSSPTAPKKLNETLENRFQIAQGAALQDGVNLQITSGYRTIERQTYLFNQAVRKYGSYKSSAKWVAPPELSHHPLGLAIDVNYPEKPDSAKWLEING